MTALGIAEQGVTRRGGRWWLRSGLVGAGRFVLALLVFGAAELLSTQGDSPRMPLWVVLIATGVVAVVFWLVRKPMDRLVDRLVLGERAGGYEAGRALLRRMATTLPVDDVVPALAETAGRTMHSARAEVRLLLSDGDPWSRVWPEQAVAEGSPVTVGVRHGGTDVGEIQVDLTDPSESDRDRQLLDELARPAGLALSTVRMTIELRQRAVELETITAALARSNQRIVDARRSEAVRVQAEMQDRVMPYLEQAQSVIAREIDSTESEPPGPARERVDLARAEITEALEALRILARGIYPPRLADAGLAVSLEGWQQRSGLAADIRIEGDQDGLHRTPEIESCLYFSLTTALSALRPDDERPSAMVAVDEVGVSMTVTGTVGGTAEAEAAHTAAMLAVEDRVEAFGGRVDATVADGRSVLRGWVPLVGAADSLGSPGTALPPGVPLSAVNLLSDNRIAGQS
jgi:hypothetical protein